MSEYIISAKIDVDSRSVGKVNNEVNRMQRELNGASRQSDQMTRNLVRGAKLATTAVAATAAAIFNVTRSTLNANQAINDAALFTGESTRELANLAASLELVGVGFDRTVNVVNRLNEAVAQASDGNQRYIDLLDGIGLSYERLQEQSPAEVLQEIVIAINNTEDAATRARAINQLLGRSNTELLKLGSSYRELATQQVRAAQLGIDVGQDQIELADRFDVAKNQIAASMTAISNSIVRAFGPDLVEGTENLDRFLTDNLVAIDDFITDSRNKFDDFLKVVPDDSTPRELSWWIDFKIIPDSPAERLWEWVTRREVPDALRLDVEIGGESITTYEEFAKRVEESSLVAARQWVRQNESHEHANDLYDEYLTKAHEAAEVRTKEAEAAAATAKSLQEANKMQDDAADEVAGYVDELEKYDQLVRGITDQTQLQHDINEALNSGRIRTAEELDRFLQFELEVTRLVNQARRDGIEITEEDLRKRLEERREAEENNNRMIDLLEEQRQLMDSIGGALSDSIADGLMEGRLNFSDFLDDLTQMILRSELNAIFARLLQGEGSGGNIWGTLAGAFGSVGANAKGGIIDQPTFLGFRGSQPQIGGEAGPEAVLPLKRGADGNLGVESKGGSKGGSNITISNNITINNPDDAEETGRQAAQAVDRMMETKVRQILREESRSGNMLNGAIN